MICLREALLTLNLFLAWRILFPDRQASVIERLCDVVSPDPNVVKQWLTAKLNFAQPVIRLSDPEFQMRGGRIDVIKNRQVATLVYEGSKDMITLDMITLFLWPSAGQPLGAGDWSVSGYHAFTWNAAGYFFCGRFLFK